MSTITLKPQGYSFRPMLARLQNVFSVLGAAIAVSAAVESRRKPQDSDLVTLGINPVTFNAAR